MKFILTLLALTLGAPTFAALTNTDLQQTTFINNLKNAGFENGQYGWTSSNGTFTSSTLSYTQGFAGGHISLSSNIGDLISQSITPTSSTTGQNWEASCKVSTILSTIQLCALSSGVEQNCVSVPSSGNYTPMVSYFMPVSGSSVGVKIKATATSSGAVDADECYVGPARGIGTAAQASIYGGVTWLGTTSCTWTQSSIGVQSYTSYNTNANCTLPAGANIQGNASAPATKIPAITFASLPAGDYEITAAGHFNPGNNRNCSYAFFDGTTRKTAGIIGGANDGAGAVTGGNTITTRFSYTTAQSNITFQIQGSGQNSTDPCVIPTASTPSEDLNIWVKYYPNSQSQIVNPNVTPASWSGRHNNSCAFTASSASYADMTQSNASCALVEIVNTNFGSVSSYGGTGASAKAGIIVTPPKTGAYQVCASFALVGTGNFDYKLVDGSGTLIAEQTLNSASTATPATLCGQYNATSLSATTFKLQEQSSSAGPPALTVATHAPNASVNWSILQLITSMGSPTLTGLGQSELRLDSSTGNGSTNTTNAKFTNSTFTGSNATTDFTYTSSATLGDSITVNRTGMYLVSLSANHIAAGGVFGLSVNNASNTTCNNTMTYAQGFRGSINPSANGSSFMSTPLWLSNGDVIRECSDTSTLNNNTMSYLDVIRVF